MEESQKAPQTDKHIVDSWRLVLESSRRKFQHCIWWSISSFNKLPNGLKMSEALKHQQKHNTQQTAATHNMQAPHKHTHTEPQKPTRSTASTKPSLLGGPPLHSSTPPFPQRSWRFVPGRSAPSLHPRPAGSTQPPASAARRREKSRKAAALSAVAGVSWKQKHRCWYCLSRVRPYHPAISCYFYHHCFQ